MSDVPQHYECNYEHPNRLRHIAILKGRKYEHHFMNGCDILVDPRGEEVTIFFPNGVCCQARDNYSYFVYQDYICVDYLNLGTK